MRHKVKGRTLGRNATHRKAMFRNMAASFIRTLHAGEDDPNKPKVAGRIITTVEKAKELLQYTTFNVSEVSLQVGFKSIFHFSKVFRQLSGRNPSEFKQFRYQPK